MIVLSTIEIPHNFDVLVPLMWFWSTSLNTFCFPMGMLTPILLDVAAILGLPARGRKVHVDPNFPTDGLVYEHDSAFQNLLSWDVKKSCHVTDAEHQAFLMYFFNKYVYIINSFTVIKELHPFVCMLLSYQGYSWGSFFLALLYKGKHSLLDQVCENGYYSTAQGPIWLLQLWGATVSPKSLLE